VDEATFDRIMAVNIKGPFLGVKYAAPVMKGQRSGVILVAGSTSAVRPRPGVQGYSASKGAVHVMAKSLALELAPFGVRVVAIAPGATEPPMLPAFRGKSRRGVVAPFGVRGGAIAPVATETPMLPAFMGKDTVDDEGMARYRS